MVGSIESEGNSASGFLLNAVETDSIEERVAAVEAEIGPIEVVVFNLGAQIGDRALKDTSYKVFELGWRMATFGLFRLASAVCPLMEERGKGTIIVTSATAAAKPLLLLSLVSVCEPPRKATVRVVSISISVRLSWPSTTKPSSVLALP